jgi:hypothetical protein
MCYLETRCTSVKFENRYKVNKNNVNYPQAKDLWALQEGRTFLTGVFTNALTQSDGKSSCLLAKINFRKILMLPLMSAFMVRPSFILYKPRLMRRPENSGMSASPYLGMQSKSTALALEV